MEHSTVIQTYTRPPLQRFAPRYDLMERVENFAAEAQNVRPLKLADALLELRRQHDHYAESGFVVRVAADGRAFVVEDAGRLVLSVAVCEAQRGR